MPNSRKAGSQEYRGAQLSERHGTPYPCRILVKANSFDAASKPRVTSCSAARSPLLRRPAGGKEEGRGERGDEGVREGGGGEAAAGLCSVNQAASRSEVLLSLSVYLWSILLRLLPNRSMPSLHNFDMLIRHYQLFKYVYRIETKD